MIWNSDVSDDWEVDSGSKFGLRDHMLEDRVEKRWGPAIWSALEKIERASCRLSRES